MKKMKTQLFWVTMILVAITLVSSCKKEDDKVDPGDAFIISFKIGDVVATINESAKTITADLAPGTDLSALQPVIVLSAGATVTPASGTTVDFTNPATFTVKDVSGTVTNTYTVTLTSAEMHKIAFLGAAAENTASAWELVGGTDFDLMDDRTAADWFFATMASSTTEVAYFSFEDVANGADLSSFHALWIQYDGGWWGGEVAQFPHPANHCILGENGIVYDTPCPALSDDFILAIKNYYEAGGCLFLGNYAGSIVDEIGVVSSPDYAPNNSWGGLTVDEGATASAWGVRWAGDPTSPMFEGISLNTDPGCLAPAFIMIEAGGEKKNRSNQYNLDFGPWAPNGDADPLAQRRASFETMTGAKILMENCGQNEPQMVMWDATGNKGTVVAALAGTYDWYIGATMTNTDRNVKTLTKNILNHLVDLNLAK
ncbi:MAG: DUF4960 domain-containing protein [Lentimicrobium sp.]